MKLIIITTCLISLTLLSCGKDPNGGQFTNERDEQQLTTSEQSSPKYSFLLKDQKEPLYIDGEIKKLKIILRPINQKVANYESLRHQLNVFKLPMGQYQARVPFGICTITEERVTGFKVIPISNLISSKELSLTINDQIQELKDESSLENLKSESIFTVNLPDNKEEHFLHLSTLLSSFPIKNKFNTEECEKAIASNRSFYAYERIDLNEYRTQEKVWATYQVEIYEVN